MTKTEETEQNSVKRLKTMEEDATLKVFSSWILKEDSIQQLAHQFQTSEPYCHCVISSFVEDSLLESVREEVATRLHFTQKETDIYRVWQTGDLANLDGLKADEHAQLQHLMRLRNALYSDTFRQTVRQVTGCGPLSGRKIDLSVNRYTDGCHLLCHDDVIGTRRVSYILYLTDKDWNVEQDGGGLELYSCRAHGTPTSAPVSCLGPVWNQLTMFTVQPGASFHAVQEVVRQTRQGQNVETCIPTRDIRLSISGWFHAPLEGEQGYEEEQLAQQEEKAPASLEQLESVIEDPMPLIPFETEILNILTPQDKQYLGEWLNPRYLDERLLSTVCDRYNDASSLQLVDFLRADKAALLQSLLGSVDEKQFDRGNVVPNTRYRLGMRGPWRVQGPTHTRRYLRLSTSETDVHDYDEPESEQERQLKLLESASEEELKTDEMLQSLCVLMESPAMARWLYLATQVCLVARRIQVRRFRSGLDYTLATPCGPVTLAQGASLSYEKELQLEAQLCLLGESEKWQESSGGYICYMAPDDNQAADPAVYRKEATDENSGVLMTSPLLHNVLTVASRESDVLSFVKYISTRVQGSRWDVSGRWAVQSD